MPEEIQEAKEVQEEAPQEKPREPSVLDQLDDLLVFGKWSYSDVEVEDKGLQRYINLIPVTIPHSGAKHANKTFGKGKMNVVERLINGMMRTGMYSGKKMKAYKVVGDSFGIIEKKTGENPIQILVNAIENASPREEITRLRFGGISVPKSVDISPSRRLDIAIRNITKGAVNTTYKNKRSIEVCLANELINASNGDMNSFAVSKKEERERVATSAR